MTDVIVATVLCAVVIVGPLAWRIWTDRRESRALQLRADINATVNRQLEGESLVTVQVIPPAPVASWRRYPACGSETELPQPDWR